jgi:hypothetical protein
MKKNDIDQKREEVATRLSVGSDRVVPLKGSAKSFLESANIAQVILDHMPKASDNPF